MNHLTQYGVILADPPWSYDNGGNGAAKNHYPTMTQAEICALPVATFAAADAVLLMWATWPHLPDALEVISAWGAKYITGFPWVKVTDVSQTLWGEITVTPHFGIGFWARGASEPLLIAKWGKPSPPTANFVGLFSAIQRHSRKPDTVYHYAESLNGPYLEMFARRPRAGWDTWGNEIPNSVALDGEEVRQ